MDIPRSKLVKFFKDVGFSQAGNWSKRVLLARLVKMLPVFEAEKEETWGVWADFVKEVLPVIREGATINIVEDLVKLRGLAEVDIYGSRYGSLGFAINRVVTNDWKSETDIAKEAGYPLSRARWALYSGVRRGFFEKRRRFEYRINPKWRLDK